METKIVDQKTNEWMNSFTNEEKERFFDLNNISKNLINDFFVWRMLFISHCKNYTFIEKCNFVFTDNSEDLLLKSYRIKKSDKNVIEFINGLTCANFKVYYDFSVQKFIVQNTNKKRVSNYEIKNPFVLIKVMQRHVLDFELFMHSKQKDLIKLSNY